MWISKNRNVRVLDVKGEIEKILGKKEEIIIIKHMFFEIEKR